MTHHEALELITRHLARFAGCEPTDILPTTHLIDDLAIESIDAVELLIGVERETDIQIEVEMLDDITTVQDLASRLHAASTTSPTPGAS